MPAWLALPAIGAALAAVGRWIIGYFLLYAGSLVVQALLFLGLRLVSHKVVDGFMKSTFSSLFAGLPGPMLHVIGLMRADIAVSIVLSAVVYKIGKDAVVRLAAKPAT